MAEHIVEKIHFTKVLKDIEKIEHTITDMAKMKSDIEINAEAISEEIQRATASEASLASIAETNAALLGKQVGGLFDHNSSPYLEHIEAKVTASSERVIISEINNSYTHLLKVSDKIVDKEMIIGSVVRGNVTLFNLYENSMATEDFELTITNENSDITIQSGGYYVQLSFELSTSPSNSLKVYVIDDSEAYSAVTGYPFTSNGIYLEKLYSEGATYSNTYELKEIEFPYLPKIDKAYINFKLYEHNIYIRKHYDDGRSTFAFELYLKLYKRTPHPLTSEVICNDVKFGNVMRLKENDANDKFRAPISWYMDEDGMLHIYYLDLDNELTGMSFFPYEYTITDTVTEI